MVLAAVVATRWFDARRGLVMGMLSAANATGQLVFLTPLAMVVESSSWRPAALIVAAAAAIVFVLVWRFMRDRPAWHHRVPNADEYARALQELDEGGDGHEPAI